LSDTVKISGEERDLLYHRIMLHLSGIDRVWLAARHHDFAEADRLGRQVCDELQLVLEDLGWGETHGDGAVELASPPDLVRRVVLLLRDLASPEKADERKSREAMQNAEDENRQVREMCDGLLEALDRVPVAPGEWGDG
jgi:hypothetical protein